MTIGSEKHVGKRETRLSRGENMSIHLEEAADDHGFELQVALVGRDDRSTSLHFRPTHAAGGKLSLRYVRDNSSRVKHLRHTQLRIFGILQVPATRPFFNVSLSSQH